MAQYDGSIRINTKIGTKEASSQLLMLENRIKKTADKITSLRSKMDALKDVKIPTEEYKEVSSQIAKVEQKISDLQAQQERFLATGGKANSSAYKKMEYDLEELRNSLPYLQGELQDLVDTGKAFTLGSDTQEYANMEQQMEYLQNDLSALVQKHDEVVAKQGGVSDGYKKIGNVAKKAFSSIGRFLNKTKSHIASFGKSLKNIAQKIFPLFNKSAKKSGSAFSSFGARLKSTILSLLVFNQITKAFDAMIAGVKEGFNNLALYSNQTNANLSTLISGLAQLKNSLATAFDPILTIVTPALTQLISLLSQATSYVAQFMSAITGKSTYTKAIKVEKDYAESLKGTADAAKEAEGSLSAYDKLNSLQKEKESGGSGEASVPEFEEVEIETPIKEFADKIKDSFSNIFDVFKEAWKNKGQEVIDAAKKAFKSLIDAAKAIGQTFYDVFTSDIGVAWVESVLNLLRSVLGVIDAIATAFTEAWKSGAGVELVTALFVMLTNVNNLLAAIGDSFARAFSSGVGVQIWTNLLGIITGVFNIIGNLARQIQTAWETSGLGDSIWTGILNIINTILETIHNIVDATAEWAGNLDVTPLLQSIDTLLKALEPLTENIGAGLEWFWNNVLLPIASWTIEEAVPTFLNMLSAAIDTLNSVIDVLKPLGQWLWENFLKPLGEWAGDTIISAMETITGLLEDFSDWIKDNKQTVENFAIVLGSFAAAWGVVIAAVTLWNTVGAIAAGVSTALGTAITFLTSPIGIVTVAIGALIAGLVLLVKHWDTVKATMEKFDQWLTGVFSHDWTEEFGTFGDIINAFFHNVGEVWNSIKEIFNGIITFIKGMFAGDWEQAWEGIKQILKGVWDGIVAVVKAPINMVIGMINSMITGITSGLNTVIDALNKIHIDIPDWVPGLGGESFGINIPKITPLKIPYLATGAVIPPNKEFLAVLGDQKRGTNIEAPLDTIIDAVKQANKEMGNGNGTGSGKVEVVLMLDSREVARELIDLNKQNKKRTGKPLLA